MLNFTYRDLKHLQSVLSKDFSTDSSYLLAKVYEELDRVPAGFDVCCLYSPTNGPRKDIYFLGEQALRERLHRNLLEPQRPFLQSIAIVCPNDYVSHEVFTCFILNDMPVKSISTLRNTAKLSNGIDVSVFSHTRMENADRGRIFDLGIVYTGADGPSA